MCAPKVPKIEPIPVRQAARLPDQGDTATREDSKRRKRAGRAMILPTLGLPSVAGNAPLGI